MKHSRLTLAFVAICGCGASGPSPENGDTENPEPIAADANCEAKDEVKQGAKPTPAPMGCMDQADFAEAVGQCNNGDADKCWGVGSCLSLDLLSEKITGDDRTSRESMAKDAFRTACDAGIADACMARAGLYTDQKTNDESRQAACADAIRACHLGHAIGCSDCVLCGG